MYKKTEGKTDTITDIQIDRMIKDKVDNHSAKKAEEQAYRKS
jgi:hypothetical protein